MLLNQIFLKAPAIEIKGICTDSRNVYEGCIFFCVKGKKYDGHNFINQAIEKGAKVIVYNNADINPKGAIFIKVKDVLKTLTYASSIFHNQPSTLLKMIGIMGGSGKNAVMKIFEQLALKNSFAFINKNNLTYENYQSSIYQDYYNATNQLYKNLALIVEENIENCVIKISDDDLRNKRLNNQDFNIVCFTNSTTSESSDVIYNNYFHECLNFISDLKVSSKLILNNDDDFKDKIIRSTKAQIITYGINNDSDYMITDIVVTNQNTSFTFKAKDKIYRLSTSLIGKSNLYNVLTVLTMLSELNFDIKELVNKISCLTNNFGFMTKINLNQKFNVLIDVCDSLEIFIDILEYARQITPKGNKIIVVFGANGKKASYKRKKYGELLNKYADLIILCENNPRDESVIEICQDISQNIVDKNSVIIEDRSIAIDTALNMLNANDTLLILGKGNEKIMYREFSNDYYEGDLKIATNIIRDILNKEEEDGII